MTRIRKAVIPTAGRGTRQYPASGGIPKGLFTIVDRDGVTKTTIQIVAEEALESGIEAICIVVKPGDEAHYRRYFTSLPEEVLVTFKDPVMALQQSERLARLREIITYVPQPTPEGYGHAVWCARDFVGDEPFLLLLGDHAFISHTDKRCARQVMDVFEQYGKSVYALQRTPEDRLHLFGTVQGRRVQDCPPVYELSHVKEKPDLAYAREHFRVAGLPEGTYLCFFGIHALTPGIFDAIEYHIRYDIRENGEIQLTNAQELLREREGAYGCEVQGERYDMGIPLGLIETQIALGLAGVYQDEVRRILQRLMNRYISL